MLVWDDSSSGALHEELTSLHEPSDSESDDDWDAWAHIMYGGGAVDVLM